MAEFDNKKVLSIARWIDRFAQEDVAPERIFEWIRARKTVSDRVFDSIYPKDIQDLSSVHWTPIRVIRRAIEVALDEEPIRVLDVGSGAGKFCLIGALLSNSKFVGVEQRQRLVEVSSALAREQGMGGVSFIHGNAFELDWNEFDLIYLFNPFSENIDQDLKIDETIELNRATFDRYVEQAEDKLAGLESGKRVLIYNGFGGTMPDGFSLMTSDVFGTAKLEMWLKMSWPTLLG